MRRLPSTVIVCCGAVASAIAEAGSPSATASRPAAISGLRHRWPGALDFVVTSCIFPVLDDGRIELRARGERMSELGLVAGQSLTLPHFGRDAAQPAPRIVA